MPGDSRLVEENSIAGIATVDRTIFRHNLEKSIQSAPCSIVDNIEQQACSFAGSREQALEHRSYPAAASVYAKRYSKLLRDVLLQFFMDSSPEDSYVPDRQLWPLERSRWRGGLFAALKSG